MVGHIVCRSHAIRGVRRLSFAKYCVRVNDEVAKSLASGGPVVALESTIVAHGMPWPQNLEAALAVEAAVRAGGAVPATVGVIDGVPTVGLTEKELEAMARGGPEVPKCSTRELPLVVARKQHGATTVAATARLAKIVGLEVFVTGGLGGVHRGGELTLDVSADLVELRTSPLVVVCAGVKSILDIARTLEYLETQGVPVVSYQTNDFPAFFSPTSGLPSPARLDTPQEVASHFLAARSLGLESATLLAVPNPEPAADGEAVQAAIHAALAAAAEVGVSGAATTPFVLSFVARATGGASLQANIALVLNNAKVGTAVAVALAEAKRVLR